jgi:hypothetical protein
MQVRRERERKEGQFFEETVRPEQGGQPAQIWREFWIAASQRRQKEEVERPFQ